LHFDGGSTFGSEDADRFIRKVKGKTYLDMDYVEGRQVKTGVSIEEDGSLAFNSWIFERDRGNPDPVFKRANEILKSKHPSAALPVEVTSTKNQFKGDSLTLRLKELGYERIPGETDEQLRGRIFLSLFKRDAILAGEFIFGKHEVEWTGPQRSAYIGILRNNRSDQFLQEFADTLMESDKQK